MSHTCAKPKTDGKTIEMELDYAVFLISTELYDAQFCYLPLHQTSMILKTYTGEMISPEGVITVSLNIIEQRTKLLL